MSNDDPPPTDETSRAPDSRVVGGVLTLLDYASLARGLELLPARRSEVLACFELDETLGTPEIARWKAWLEKHPQDEVERIAMGERMTDYWRRWDKTTQVVANSDVEEEKTLDPEHAPLEVLASLSQGLELLPDRRAEVFGVFGARTHEDRRDLMIALDRIVGSRDLDVVHWLTVRSGTESFWRRWLEPPTISLFDYAQLIVELERAPKNRALSIYRNHRLARVSAERELHLWERILAGSPDEKTRYDHLREQLLRGSSEPVRGVAPPSRRDRSDRSDRSDRDFAPHTARAVAGHGFLARSAVPLPDNPNVPHTTPAMLASRPSEPLVSTPRPVFQAAPPPALAPKSGPPPLGLLEYTVLCVQLELDGARTEMHYQRLGLMTNDQRDGVHAYWQARFEVDPGARAEWLAQANRLRKNWQGARK